MKVSILVFEDSTALACVVPMEMLCKANEVHAMFQGGGPPAFDVELVTPGPNPVITAHGFPVTCHRTISEVTKTDLVVIPALDWDILPHLGLAKSAIPWIQAMYAGGADLVSVCTGAFVLAEAGLLDGRTATTHWFAMDEFRARYPKVQVLPERIIVDEGRICTSGGATAVLNLMAYLVEKFCGRQTAAFCSRLFLIDPDKAGQGAYAIFSAQKDHRDETILRAQAIIEEKAGTTLTVEDVARAVSTTGRTFVRRFKSATGNTPIAYIQRVRVEAAKRALEATSEPVDAIARRVGYDDLGAFRRIFVRYVGLNPREYRLKYRRPSEAAPAGK